MKRTPELNVQCMALLTVNIDQNPTPPRNISTKNRSGLTDTVVLDMTLFEIGIEHVGAVVIFDFDSDPDFD